MQDSSPLQPATETSRVSPHAFDNRLLTTLCVHAVVAQLVYAMLRVTISYRAIELGLDVYWVGIISGASAVLPMVLAVAIGRFVDRGHDALTARVGSVMMLGCCLGYRISDAGLTELLVLTTFLGVGHTLLMVSQQMLCVRASKNDVSRETAFGHYMLANAFGQGVGPLIVAWIGGSARIPPTRLAFGIAVGIAFVSLLISLTIRVSDAASKVQAANSKPISVKELLTTEGVPTLMFASVITVTAQDLIVIYLPLLGAQRGIEVAHVGALLMVRSITAVVSRVFYPSMMRAVGRVPLTVSTMAAATVGLTVIAMPVPIPVLYVAMAVAGFGLGIAATLSISNMVDIVPPGARGVALSLRITGNRVGQVSLPVMAGVVAMAMGAGGIFGIIAVTLAASAASVHVVRGRAMAEQRADTALK
jgi:hypothetical protein